MAIEIAQKRNSTEHEKALYADQIVKDGQEMANQIFKKVSGNPICKNCGREVSFICKNKYECPNYL